MSDLERNAVVTHRMQPVLDRLRGFASCPDEQIRRIEALGRRVQCMPAKGWLQDVDEPAHRPRYVLSGWACRFRQLADGRRQLFDLILPGDGLGVYFDARAVAITSAQALTDVETVDASSLVAPEQLLKCPEFVHCLHAAARQEDGRRLDQIVRLGRLTALERLAHLLLELHQRMAVIGQAVDGRFPLPLTQEMLADLLGLSTVHVNRTLQELRRAHLADLSGGVAIIHNHPALAALVEFAPH